MLTWPCCRSPLRRQQGLRCDHSPFPVDSKCFVWSEQWSFQYRGKHPRFGLRSEKPKNPETVQAKKLTSKNANFNENNLFQIWYKDGRHVEARSVESWPFAKFLYDLHHYALSVGLVPRLIRL